MIRRALSFDVPPRILAGVALLVGALLVAVVAGGAREERALEEAAGSLRGAVVEAAGLVTCFQGVQDDLYGARSDRAPGAVAQARSRLAGCDVGALSTAVSAIRLPHEPPLATGARRNVRRATEDARTILDRVILDARGTKRAMAEDLSGERFGTPVVLGYRATNAGYQEAVALLAEVEVLLGRPGGAPVLNSA